MSEICGRVVAAPRLDAIAGDIRGESDAYLPELPVLRRVRRPVSDEVVRGHVALDPGEGGREVIGIEKRLTACIGGNRAQGFLRRVERTELGEHGAPGKDGRSAPSPTTTASATGRPAR